MDQISAILIGKALDGLSMRMEATATNIANAQTQGYRPLRVDFEDALATAAKKDVSAIHATEPQLRMAPVSDIGGEVRLDMEMASATATGARYAALIDILNRQMQLGRLAVGGGQ